MIKRILLASIMMLTVTLNANNIKTSTDSVKSTVEQVLPDSSQLTFKEVYSDIKAGLLGISVGLKVGVEHVYEIISKQQLVNSITNITIIILLLIIFLLSYKLHNYYIKKNHESFGENPRCMLPVLSLIFLIIFTIVTMQDTVMGFVNPEYGAIKNILEFIK